MTIFLGSDHAGFNLKIYIQSVLKSKNFDVVDCGCFDGVNSVDYPDIAIKTCKELILHKEKDAKAILFCGSGVGMAIAANKVEGIRAVNSTDFYSVKYARKHNDVNVLCLGGRVIGECVAVELVNVFLNTDFEGGRHIDRVNKLKNVRF